jgi:hypothetical protein
LINLLLIHQQSCTTLATQMIELSTLQQQHPPIQVANARNFCLDNRTTTFFILMTERSNDQRGGPDEEVTVETNWDEVITSFDDMDLKEDLLRGIYAYGFEKPSAIQQVSSLKYCEFRPMTPFIESCKAHS